MVTVTERAKDALREWKQRLSGSCHQGFRLESDSPGEVNILELDIDRPGDQVFESRGVRILFVAPGVSKILGDIVLDCEQTAEQFDKKTLSYLHLSKPTTVAMRAA